MRIGVVTSSYPRCLNDYAGRFVADLNHWLVDHGDDVEVLAPSPARTERQDVVVRTVTYANRGVLCYGGGLPDNLWGASTAASRKIRAWAQLPRFGLALARGCRRYGASWHAALSHWLVPNGLAVSMARRELPHVVIAHGSDVRVLRRLPGREHVLRRLLGPRTRLVFTTEALRERLVESTRDPAVRHRVISAGICRMGTEAPKPHPMTRSAFRDRHGLDDRPLVCFVGRLVPCKGVEHAISACAQLRGRVQLAIVGDGPERCQLQRSAGTSVRFAGTQLGAEKWTWLSQADLVVIPSVRRGGLADSAPLVLVEALSLGATVIATDVADADALISSGVNGYVVPSGNASALASCIASCLERSAMHVQRVSDAARATGARYSWDRVGPSVRRELALAVDGVLGRAAVGCGS